jgi:hypothetical protein
MTLQKLIFVLAVPLSLLPVTLSLKIPASRSTDAYKKPVATQRAPTPTPAPVLQNQIFRRDQRTCGALQGGYPDSDGPPVCPEGLACTFTSNSGYQGCCKGESCAFYTTCYAYSDQGSCTGSCTSSGLVWYVGRSIVMYCNLIDSRFGSAQAQRQNALDISIKMSWTPCQAHGRASLVVCN